MNDTQRKVVLAALVEKLHETGDWCGETHVQKNTYFLEELFDVDLGYDFILYKHGPFSFELRDELSGLRSDQLLDLEPRPSPYGPSLIPTDAAKALEARFPKTLAEHEDAIEFVTGHLGNKGVVELERLATALLVTRENPNADVDERATRLVELKPHVSLDDARTALEAVDGIIAESVATAA
jgi:hypothetical protein